MTRTTRCEILFRMVDVTAHDDSTPSCEDVQPFVNLQQLKEDELKVANYATLERNHFVLDGSMKLFPDSPSTEKMGLWSKSRSGADGLFPAPIVLDVKFKEPHSSLGLMFRFQEYTNDYCNHLSITWYGGDGGQLSSQEYWPDSAYYFCDHQIHEYSRVAITFYEANRADRYLRVAEVIFGVVRIFGDSNLISATALEETDPVSTQLKINTLNFKFHSDGEFSLLDMRGVWSFLQWKQKMHVYETVSGEKAYLGAYYLDEPEAESENETSMKCIDLLGVIDQTTFKGGMYVDKPAADLIKEIMISAGESGGFALDEALASIKLDGWIPICTHREALHQVAFAIGAVVDCSRSEQIRLYPFPTTASGTVGYDCKVIGHQVKLETLVTGVEITAHTYTPAEPTDQDQELQNGFLPVGVHEITWQQPIHTLSISGATLAEHGVNYAKVNVVTEGTVVVKGKPYHDNAVVCGAYLPELPPGAKANIRRADGATMVSAKSAPDVAKRLYDYYQLRYQDSGSILLSSDQVGQRVMLESMDGQRIDGIVESLEIDLTGGYLAKTKITGKVAPTT